MNKYFTKSAKKATSSVLISAMAFGLLTPFSSVFADAAADIATIDLIAQNADASSITIVLLGTAGATGLVDTNLTAYQNDISTAANFELDTIEEIQAMVDSVNSIAAEAALVQAYTDALDAAAFVTLLDANALTLDLTNYAELDAIGKTEVGTIMLGVGIFADKAAVQFTVSSAITDAKPASDARIALADAKTAAGIETAKVTGAQSDYTAAGGSDTDLVYTDVTAANEAVATAIASNVTANILSTTETLTSKLGLLTTATTALTDATALSNAITAAGLETVKVAGAQSAYTTAGGLVGDAVYTDVTTANEAVATAITSNVTADILSTTATLTAKLGLLTTATTALTDAIAAADTLAETKLAAYETKVALTYDSSNFAATQKSEAETAIASYKTLSSNNTKFDSRKTTADSTNTTKQAAFDSAGMVVNLKSGWNVFSTPNTLETITFSNAGAGLTFYKLEGGVYSGVTAGTGTIVPLAGFLVNNTSGSDVNVYLTAKTGLTANQKLHQKALSAGWNILGTTTNTNPFSTIGTSATSKIDLTEGSTNTNKVHTTFSPSPTYETGEAYGVFMSANGIYGGNE